MRLKSLWLEALDKNNEISKISDHKKILKYLNILRSNYDKLIIFLIEIAKYSDDEGLIDEGTVESILRLRLEYTSLRKKKKAFFAVPKKKSTD